MPKCPFCDQTVPLNTQTCPHCRGPLATSQPESIQDLEQRVRSLLDQGEKIQAIKVYREETGSSLLDAKNAVEALDAGAALPVQERPVDGDWEADVLQLLSEGKKIQAIKRYRERIGGGLKEAKEAVESLGKRHGIVGRGGGCLGVGVLMAAIVLAILSVTEIVAW